MASTMLPFLYQTRTLCPRAYFKASPLQARRSFRTSFPCRSKSASTRSEDRVDIGARQKDYLSKNLKSQSKEYAGRPSRNPSVGRKLSDTDQGPFAVPERNGPSNNGTILDIPRDSTVDNNEEQDEIPFLSLPESFDQNDDWGKSELSGTPVLGDSTITIREKRAFDQIFADIMARSDRAGKRPQQESSSKDSQSSNGTNLSAGVRQGLDTQYSRKVAGRLSEGARLSSSDIWSSKDSQDVLRTAVDRYPQALRAAAAKALGLAPVRSFPRSEEEEQSEEVEDAGLDKLEETRQLERQRVEGLMRAAATDAELWKIMEEEVFSLISRLGLAGDSTGDDHLKLSSPEPLDRLVYGPLYPSHLLLCIRLLDRSFVRPSPLVLNLLPRIKSLGIISHVLGTSTAFYNELLRIYWLRYDDFRGLSKLLGEMEQSGLEFDVETRSIVNAIRYTQRRVRRGDQGPSLKALSSMPEFAQGKLKAWHKKIKSQMEERDQYGFFRLAR